jgi:hypothetical protein
MEQDGRAMTVPQSLDDKRVAMVNEHMRLENAYDFPACVGVFGRPQYQLVADGELYEMCLIFEFDGESMTNEKIYFDLNTPLLQLGIGDDYNSLRGKLSAVLGHPVVILKALIFSLTHRRKPRTVKPTP